MQQQIGEERHAAAVEERIGARSRRQRGDVAGGAPNRSKHALTQPRGFVDLSATDRRQQPHEALEIVNPSTVGARISHILGVRNGVAVFHLR